MSCPAPLIPCKGIQQHETAASLYSFLSSSCNFLAPALSSVTPQLFQAVGKEPRIVKAPVALFDIIINSLDFLARFLPQQFEDPAELAKIGKYYAVEDMLTTDPSEKVSAMRNACCNILTNHHSIPVGWRVFIVYSNFSMFLEGFVFSSSLRDRLVAMKQMYRT